jgi:hypothetical protein
MLSHVLTVEMRRSTAGDAHSEQTIPLSATYLVAHSMHIVECPHGSLTASMRTSA